MLNAHVRLAIHGKSKDGGDCTAANIMCLVFHVCMLYAREFGFRLEYFEMVADI
jgi:hypothetical protein